MADEPSVLDFVKSLLTPWKGAPLKIPAGEETADVKREVGPSVEIGETNEQEVIQNGGKAEPDRVIQRELPSILPDPAFTLEIQERLRAEPAAQLEALAAPSALSGRIPWRALIALGLALVAQRALEPFGNRQWDTGAILYMLAAGWLAWAAWHEEWQLPDLPLERVWTDPLTVNSIAISIGLPMAIIGYLFYGGNLFTRFNFFWGLLALGLLLYGFWLGRPIANAWWPRLRRFLRRPTWQITITRWGLLIIAVVVLTAFFRFTKLPQVPPEMTSDHAEKILDIVRVVEGQTNIFFPNNGGREGLEMYMVAAMHNLLGMAFSFLTIKIAMSIVGFLTLPVMYLLGKEVGNRRVGLLVFAFTGVSYWGNLVSRVGLRLPFTFLFTATTLYFLLRGIRTARRNDFILAGVSLGLSMYGYSANRILPVMVLAAVGLYLVHRQSKGQRQQVIWVTGILLLLALVVFIPMLRYMVDQPESFFQRTLTRMGSTERPLPGPIIQLFLSNTWRALTMFSWSDGEVWLASVPFRPALDIVSGALFWSGVLLAAIRYLRRRHWLDLFLILSIPILMLPSILSLAFPNENPNLYRTGGALIPVFLLVGLALDGWMTGIEKGFGRYWGGKVAWGAAVLLLAWSSYQSYDLVFNQYKKQYQESDWNTSEMAQVIRGFIGVGGTQDSAWLVGYPYWADSRVLGIAAGFPTKDFAIWPDQFESTLAVQGAKLFLLSPQDQADVNNLQQLYPKGWLQVYQSKIPNKNFFIYFVPPQ